MKLLIRLLTVLVLPVLVVGCSMTNKSNQRNETRADAAVAPSRLQYGGVIVESSNPELIKGIKKSL